MKNLVFLLSLEILNYAHLNLVDFLFLLSQSVFLLVQELQGLVFLYPTLTPFVCLPAYPHIKGNAVSTLLSVA